MRVNHAVHSSRAAADDFVVEYISAGGDASAHHSYWDLLDIADFSFDAGLPESEVARLEHHIEHVLAEHARRTN